MNRNAFCALLLVGATVLVVLGKISGVEWIALVHWLGMMIVAGTPSSSPAAPQTS